jgi:hypothetical protein
MLLFVETISVGMQHGVRIDIAGLAYLAGLGLEDFEFRVGNSGDPSSFSTLTGDDLPSLTIGDGDGVDGSDRLDLNWDEPLANYDWLEIRVKSNSDTGLAADEVFGFALDEIFG